MEDNNPSDEYVETLIKSMSIEEKLVVLEFLKELVK